MTDMRTLRYISIILAVLTLGCCTKHEVPEPEPYDPADHGAATGTKFSIEGVAFSEGNTFALYVCKHEDQDLNPDGLQFVEHNYGYNNVKVTRKGSSWQFYNSILKENLSQLYISTNDEGINADVYAYAPYIENAVSPAEIPFDISRNNDLMYVSQNASKTVNKNMLPSSVESDVALTFHHVLAKLSFRMKIKNDSPVSTHTVDSIVIRKAGGKGTELYKTGVFNAMTGTLTNNSTADSISFKHFFSYTSGSGVGGTFNQTTGKDFNVMLYPVEFAADGDLEVILWIDGFRKVFPIMRDNVKHSNGTTFGFVAANEYVFNITIDNYVHLDGVTIKPDWTPGEYSDEI